MMLRVSYIHWDEWSVNLIFRNELLPLLIKACFPEVSLVPICNGKCEGMLVAKLPEPVIVISTV